MSDLKDRPIFAGGVINAESQTNGSDFGDLTMPMSPERAELALKAQNERYELDKLRGPVAERIVIYNEFTKEGVLTVEKLIELLSGLNPKLTVLSDTSYRMSKEFCITLVTGVYKNNNEYEYRDPLLPNTEKVSVVCFESFNE